MISFEELQRMTENQFSWRERLAAVEELKEYSMVSADSSGENDGSSSGESHAFDPSSVETLIMKLALHDPVFRVREAAYRLARARGYRVDGRLIQLGKKPKGELIRGITGKLAGIRDQLRPGFSREDFKEAFKANYPMEYDIYEGDKEERFDKWLDNVIKGLPMKRGREGECKL